MKRRGEKVSAKRGLAPPDIPHKNLPSKPQVDFTQKKGTEHNKKGKKQARARDRTGDLAQKC